MKSIWGEDASQFRPERWITGNAASKSQFEYAVFSKDSNDRDMLCLHSHQYQRNTSHLDAGPRICLGKSMAELEGVFVLVSTLQRFKFTLVNPKEVTYTTSLTLPMKNGLRVKVERR